MNLINENQMLWFPYEKIHPFDDFVHEFHHLGPLTGSIRTDDASLGWLNCLDRSNISWVMFKFEREFNTWMECQMKLLNKSSQTLMVFHDHQKSCQKACEFHVPLYLFCWINNFKLNTFDSYLEIRPWFGWDEYDVFDFNKWPREVSPFMFGLGYYNVAWFA
jgi:hypothetical protein